MGAFGTSMTVEDLYGLLQMWNIGARKLREANDIDIVLNSDYYTKVWKSHGDYHFLSEYLKDKDN